jgi:hypothetical protein
LGGIGEGEVEKLERSDDEIWDVSRLGKERVVEWRWVAMKKRDKG